MEHQTPDTTGTSGAGGSARLHADSEQIGRFVDCLFRYADPGTFASLRAFDQFDHTLPPVLIRPVEINGDLRGLMAVAARDADDMANTERPVVFAPPICTMSNPDRARVVDLANGLTLSVEIDDGDTRAARQRLEGLLGPATVVVASGGEWADPDTGECHPKLHLHWRLSEPTRDAEDHAKLRQARDMAARLVGADPTGKPIVHPLRWPGSLNRKGVPPRMARIVAENAGAEIHLTEAAEQLAEAADAAGLASVGMPAASGAPQAPLPLVASAMQAIPNDDAHYDTWIRFGYAGATGGGPEGYDIWDAWSRKSSKYNATETEVTWKRIGDAEPRTIGAGTIFFEAKAAGWTRHDPEPDIGPDPPPPEAPEPRGKGIETIDGDARPVIQVLLGALHTLATKGHDALRGSGLPIYQRGNTLMQPVAYEVSASNNRTTIAAGLSQLTVPVMLDKLCQAARWAKWNERKQGLAPCDPPATVAAIILSRAGQWDLPLIAGVITTPTMRPDGTILTAPGHDEATRLYHVADPALVLPAMPETPTRADAERALEKLKLLTKGFPFFADVDRSVGYSALITPVVRGAMTVAPMHGFRSPAAGTGKSYFVDLSSAR